MTEQTADRETAAGAVDEANAAIGACLSTGEPQGSTAAQLRTVQGALAEIAEAVRDRRAPASNVPDIEHPRNSASNDSLAARLSLAAGLLRLARTVVERADRSLAVLNDNRLAPAHAFLTSLPPALNSIAENLDDAEERCVPYGLCIGG